MYDFDIIADYYPTLDEIPVSKLQSARRRVQEYLRQDFTDLELAPGSVVGDMLASPMAQFIAASEVAHGRMMSDLDLEQVSNNIIYSCFRRSTEFVTRGGVRSFCDFEEGATVEVLTHLGNWKKATVRCGGKQKVSPIHIRRGKLHYEVWATKEHRWLLRDGGDTTALSVGDVLLEAPTIFRPTEHFDSSIEERLAWCYGYVFGDGTRIKNAAGEYTSSAVRLYKKEDKWLPRFLELGFVNCNPPSAGGDPVVATGRYLKQALSVSEPFHVLQAFVRGYLDADASKNHNRPSSPKTDNRKEYIKIQSTGQRYIDFVRSVFPVVGQYLTYEYDKTGEVTNKSAPGGRRVTSEFGLNNTMYDKSPKFVVEAIDGAREVDEDVWCLEVEDDRSFVLPFGLSTGNCDFVRRYLGNFAVKDTERLQSSGIVRLTFSANEAVTINSVMKFSFGDADDVFSLRLHDLGSPDVTIAPAGSGSLTDYRLAQTSLDTWSVDLPVVGVMTTQVIRGAAGATNNLLPNLVGLAAAVDFELGLPPSSLPELAKLARKTAYGASMTTRNGTRHHVFREWPETAVVSPVITGDPEMQRGNVASPMILQQPAADIYYRSWRSTQDMQQTVQIPFDNVSGKFRGMVEFMHSPRVIFRTTWLGDPDMGMVDITWYSENVDPIAAPGSTYMGTKYEQLYVEITPPTDEASVILVDRTNDGDGNPYALFVIDYLADPLLNSVRLSTESSDNAPPGVDVLVKTGALVSLQEMLVTYRKQPGIRMRLDAARTEIANYVRGVGWPELYTEGPIAEIMLNAGAARLHSVGYVGQLKPGIAARRFLKTYEVDIEDADWSDSAKSVAVPSEDVEVYADMRPTLIASSALTGDVEKWSATDRNIQYHVLEQNIVFAEI